MTQYVLIALPIDHFGFNFKCDECGAEFHIDQFGNLGKRKIVDEEDPTKSTAITCKANGCKNCIQVHTVCRDRVEEIVQECEIPYEYAMSILRNDIVTSEARKKQAQGRRQTSD